MLGVALLSTGAWAQEQAAAPVRVQFMGTTTLLFDDGKDQLLIDGFFTRPPFIPSLFGLMPKDRPGIILHALKRAGARRVTAVVVAHAHSDHALDSPDVALIADSLRTGADNAPARLAGSDSVRQIAIGRGFPVDERFDLLRDGVTFPVGDFRVTPIASPHSPSPLSEKPIRKPVGRSASILRYHQGENFSFLIEHGALSVLVHPSANALPSPPPGASRRADIVFLGLGSLGRQDDGFFETYWRSTVLDVGARTVIPIHWDDFSRSLDLPLKPLGFPLDDAQAALDRVALRATRDHIAVKVMETFAPMNLPAR